MYFLNPILNVDGKSKGQIESIQINHYNKRAIVTRDNVIIIYQ